jgi:hypothetical protein
MTECVLSAPLWERKWIFSTQKALDRRLKILALSLSKGRARKKNAQLLEK